MNKKKVSKEIKKIIDTFSTFVFYAFTLLTLGTNIFIFSIVVFKLQTQVVIMLLLGNFIIFGVFAYMFFKQMEKLQDEN